jgi:hypothetical protein
MAEENADYHFDHLLDERADGQRQNPNYVEPPISGPPQRAENLFIATVTYADGTTKETRLDIGGSRHAVSVETATGIFRNGLGPVGHVVNVQNVRKVTRAEIGRTPPIPTVVNGRAVGAVPITPAP